MVWYGMVWYGMAWYGMVWYGMARYEGGCLSHIKPVFLFLGEMMGVIWRALYLKRFPRGKLPWASDAFNALKRNL